MPLKVSSVGWVKVAPQPRTRKRQVAPEEQKESLCSSLRYFACQALDPGRERLRMLGGRAGFSSSQVDLQRPHSRLERSSTLDEWRHDVYPSRSSSRQSTHLAEVADPYRGERETNNHPGNGSRQPPHRGRAKNAPIIISASPSPSVYDDEQEVVDVEVCPDNASVAHSETASERHCRHNHKHHRSRNVPNAIPEEEESETTRSSSSRLWYGMEEKDTLASIPAPPPSPAPFDSVQSYYTEVETVPILTSVPREALHKATAPAPITATAPAVVLEPIQEQKPLEIERPVASQVESISPMAVPVTESESAGSTKSRRSKKTERSDRSDALSVSSRSTRTSKSSRSSRSSSSYASSQADTESDTASSYTASVRSASPVRDRTGSYERDRYKKAHDLDRDDRFYESKARESSRRDSHYDRNHARHYDVNERSSHYPSPPASPGPMRHRRSFYEQDAARRSYEPPSTRASRDRVATSPLPSHSRQSTTHSASSWSSKSSSISSGSSGSRSSAPSVDGYQFQAAIFQPKNNYKGYRAPSLSKGNRWETATSALSFD